MSLSECERSELHLDVTLCDVYSWKTWNGLDESLCDKEWECALVLDVEWGQFVN